MNKSQVSPLPTISRKGLDFSRWKKSGLTEEEILEIKEAFDCLDLNHDGSLDKDELRKGLENLGRADKNQTLSSMLNFLDRDKDGAISFDEYIDMLVPKVTKDNSRKELLEVFELLVNFNEENDLEKTEKNSFNKDKISFDDLKKICNHLNEEMTDEEIRTLITKTDLDEDGYVCFEELYTIMSKEI